MPSWNAPLGLPRAGAIAHWLILGAGVRGAGVRGALRTAGAARAEDARAEDARSQEDTYTSCTTLAEHDPQAAFEEATTWEAFAGGEPARHCAALALFRLAKYAEAAHRFELLAEGMERAPAVIRAEILAQAGQAWLRTNAFERARAILTIALELDARNVEILIDRSQAHAGIAAYWEALDDLNRALELAPANTIALTFRANAYRRVEALELAAEDIERALAIDRANPFALLERGIIRRLKGDIPGARTDWIAILRTAPEGAVAEAARLNLETIDLDTGDGSPDP